MGKILETIHSTFLPLVSFSLCAFLLTVFVLCVLSSFVYLLYYVCIAVLTLDAGLLARSQHPEGPAIVHLDTGFSWFPVAISECWVDSQVSKSLLHASHVALQT